MGETGRGVFLMLAAAAVLAISDTIVRLTTETMPIGEFIAFRGALSASIFALIVGLRVDRQIIHKLMDPIVLGRAILESALTVLYIASLQVLMIAEATAIFLASPIITSTIVAIIGLERVSPLRWIALVAGFFGVLLVVSPDVGRINLGAGLALGSALFVALRDIVTRHISPQVPSTVVTLVTTVGVGLAGFVLLPFESHWVVPSAHQIGWIATASVAVCFGNLLAVAAFRQGEVAVIALFRYASLPYAVLAGMLIWAELPRPTQLIGGAVIIASGVFMFRSRNSSRR